MDFSIYLDAGSHRKVTRYFHSAWRLRFVSESPVRAWQELEGSLVLSGATLHFVFLVTCLFTIKVLTRVYYHPPPPFLVES
jgi:hypothetical protein